MNERARRLRNVPSSILRRTWPCLGVAVFLLIAGCHGGPALVKTQQATIDRRLVEYPPDTELRPYVEGLTAPTAITFNNEGSLIIAEGGIGDNAPRILGFKPDGTYFQIYPRGEHLILSQIGKIVGQEKFRLYGPIGGMAYANGRLYVSHRDERGKGAITAIADDGTPTTIVAELPTQGDLSVTDIAISAGRLYFGVGAATNSGVVGLDNFRWVQEHPHFCDQSWVDLYLLGRRFDTPNPFAGILGGKDIAVTGPFQEFGKSNKTRIPRSDKPSAAIYSVDMNGGDLKVEAHGIRYPVGLAFSETGALYMTNQGMKMRGTRPVKGDPDVVLRWVRGQWYGWPDYAANLLPIRDPRFQPDPNFIGKTGYPDLSFLIDHDSSGLIPPNPNSNLLMAEFPPFAGAAKLTFAPASGPFSRLRQAGNVAIVALMGDRAPFDLGPIRLPRPFGYKVVQVNLDERQVQDFVHNTQEGPASRRRDGSMGLERPIDVKFGPDGALYILDFGYMDMKGSRERVKSGTGRVFKLVGTK